MTAHDLYHGLFYHNGALRLTLGLGWGMQLLKEDARRLGLAEKYQQVVLLIRVDPDERAIARPSTGLDNAVLDLDLVDVEEVVGLELGDQLGELDPGADLLGGGIRG